MAKANSGMAQVLATVQVLTKVLYTPVETAAILGVKVQTLAKWRCNKTVDLQYKKIGRKVMYHIDDIMAFISAA